MTLRRIIQAVARKSEGYYVAECLDLAVATQGKTLDEMVSNLQEAVSLHIKGENMAELGLIENPIVLVIMDVELSLGLVSREAAV